MKKLIQIVFVFVIGAILTFSSCKEDEDLPILPKFNFSEVGHLWDYYIIASGFKADSFFVRQIGTRSGGYHDLVQSDYGNTYTDTVAWYQTDTEFALMDTNVKNTLAKIDCKVNDYYVAYDWNDTFVFTVKGLDISTTVPAGTFKCFQVEEKRNREYLGTFYINKDVGIVRYDMPNDVGYQLFKVNF
ncbi:hypothetical protein ACFLRI_00875 [Bacteroidota bacterium]